MEGSHVSDTLNFNVSNGSLLDYVPNSFIQGHVWNKESFWVEVDTTSTSLIFRTAADFPSAIIDREEILSIYVRHYVEYNQQFLVDDMWPIENLEELSNIEGAFGIFTSDIYRTEKIFTLAIKSPNEL